MQILLSSNNNMEKQIRWPKKPGQQSAREKKLALLLATSYLILLLSHLTILNTNQWMVTAQQQSGEQQQQQRPLTGSNSSPISGGGQPAQSKIGLAPHDRPACQLPQTPTGQRRLSLDQNKIQQQSDQSLESSNDDQLANQLMQITTNHSSRFIENLTPTQQLHNKPTKLQANNKQQQQQQQQFDSSERLRLFRGLLTQNNYDAYLVTSNDEHGSEYVADIDRRLKFISGFTGSAGYALILLDRAVLFTDGRYALQADQDLDCNWWLVVGDDPLADIHLWLKANAAQGIKITASARLMSMQTYDYLEEQIRLLGSKFELSPSDFVDEIRDKFVSSSIYDPNNNNNLTPFQQPIEPLLVHPLQFNGNISWQEKVLRLVDSMSKLKARHYVISQLDEVAWLLNLRGNDIPQSPLFKAFIILSWSVPKPNSATTVLDQTVKANLLQKPPGLATNQAPLNSNPIDQLQQTLQQQATSSSSSSWMQPSQFIRLSLFVDLRKIDQQVWNHLRINNVSLIQYQRSADSQQIIIPDTATSQQQLQQQNIATARIQVDLEDYGSFIKELGDRLNPGNPKQLQGRLLLNAGANVAIHALAKEHEDRIIVVDSLIMKLKAVKSNSEVQGMRLAHWRDSLAISMLLAQLDSDIGLNKMTRKWNEVSAAKELEFYRSLMDFNRGQSFDTISAYGSNAAIVHYRPNYEANNEAQTADQEQNRLIGNQSTYLLDSGGQYLDGTTDITRTVHFGEPTEFQRETYTRVLMGSIDMMSLIFDQPKRSPYRINDIVARRHLFELGLDYSHGTGHGIGLYSLVHEAPALIEHYSTFSAHRNQQQQQQQQSQQGAGSSQPGGGGSAKAGATVESQPILLQANMFTSVEPGYYRANDFGIRLENIVVTQRVSQKSSLSRPNDRLGQQQQQRQFLRFEPISLVPFEPKMIKLELLSNKQKTWLNSYNLMVRLRMTQQINHYLSKIRNFSQTSTTSTTTTTSSAGVQSAPIVVRGVSSSSQLHQQQLLNGTTRPIDAQLGYYNYQKLDANRLQEKLEQTHKWIMSKTELIPLDVPQSFIVSNQQTKQPSQQAPMFARKRTTTSSTTSDSSSSSSSDSFMNGQRLMLAYMSSMPFNDAEAGQAIASLNQQQQQLNARAENSSLAAGSNGNEDTAAGKCHGFECDIWLVSALNSHPSSSSWGTSLGSTSAIKRSSAQDGWPEMGEESSSFDSSSSSSSSSSSKLIGSELATSLLDLFSLRDPSASGGGGGGISLGGLWSIAILSLIVVLQLGIMALMCSGASGKLRVHRSTGRRRNWCPNGQQQSPLSSVHSSVPASLRVASGNNEHNTDMRQESMA